MNDRIDKSPYINDHFVCAIGSQKISCPVFTILTYVP